MRILYGDVVPPGPRNLQLEYSFNAVQQFLPIPDLPVDSQFKQTVRDLMPCVQPVDDLQRRFFAGSLRRQRDPQFGMRMGHPAGSSRVIGIGQAVPRIDHAPEIVKMLPRRRTGWADVEASAGRQVDTGGYEVQLRVLCMNMPHPQHVVTLRGQSREGDPFELVDDDPLLFRSDRFPRGEREDSGSVSVLEWYRVDQLEREFRVAPDDNWRRPLAPGRIRIQKVADRPVARACAV